MTNVSKMFDRVVKKKSLFINIKKKGCILIAMDAFAYKKWQGNDLKKHSLIGIKDLIIKSAKGGKMHQFGKMNFQKRPNHNMHSRRFLDM